LKYITITCRQRSWLRLEIDYLEVYCHSKKLQKYCSLQYCDISCVIQRIGEDFLFKYGQNVLL